MWIKGFVSASLVAGAIVAWGSPLRAEGTEAQNDARNGAAEVFEMKTALVGTWIGTSGDGLTLLSTFNADGTMSNSIQGEVSTNPELGVLTPLHGIWTSLGGRRFGVTAFGALYDINTGASLGMLKVRIMLTVSRNGDQMTGTDHVEIITPDRATIELGSHSTPYVRVKFEPFD